eukprot:10412289-Alexandrium_andersonii.AAC.1
MPLRDPEPTTPGEESTLRRGVMEALYGPKWRMDLLDAQEARELAVEEDQALRDEGGPQEERRLVVVRPPAGVAAGSRGAESAHGPPAPGASDREAGRGV